MVCTRSADCGTHHPTTIPQSDRDKQLHKYRAQFAMLGFNFALLQVPELVAEAQRLNIDIPSFAGRKPLKHDYIYFIERHYALERIKAGKAPDHYLFPSFDPAQQYNATLRQILTQHGYRYLDNGISTATAKSADLVKLFADHIDDMRAERGLDLRDAPTPVMQAFCEEVGNMSIKVGDDTGSTSNNGQRSFACNQSLFKGPVATTQLQMAAPTVGTGVSSGSTARSSTSATGTASSATPVSATSQQGSLASSQAVRFGQTWQPKQSAASSVATKAGVGFSLHASSSMPPSTPPSTGAQPSAPKPKVTEVPHSTESASIRGVAPARALSQRKQAKLVQMVQDSMVEALKSLRSNRIADTVKAVQGLKEMFEDELDVEADHEHVAPASSRSLNQRKIRKLADRLENAATTVVTALQSSDLATCLSTVRNLTEEMEEEL